MANTANRILVSSNNNNQTNLSSNICLDKNVKCFNDGECIPLTEINSMGFKCLCKTNFSGIFCETSNILKLEF